MGDESLISKQEETNDYDRNAVSIMMDDFLYSRCSHLNLMTVFQNKLLEMFRLIRVNLLPNSCGQFPVSNSSYSRRFLTGKRVNRGAEFGVEIPVD